MDLEDREWAREVKWPKAANQLTRRIRSGASGLRAMGVNYREVVHPFQRTILLWLGDHEPGRFTLSAEDAAMCYAERLLPGDALYQFVN